MRHPIDAGATQKGKRGRCESGSREGRKVVVHCKGQKEPRKCARKQTHLVTGEKCEDLTDGKHRGGVTRRFSAECRGLSERGVGRKIVSWVRHRTPSAGKGTSRKVGGERRDGARRSSDWCRSGPEREVNRGGD